jgi:vacuolar protein sorting-associated protein 26
MEVGIDECIHIEFEYNKSHYHLKDCVVGKVSFMLMKLKIRNMFLDIIRRETIGSGNFSKLDVNP